MSRQNNLEYYRGMDDSELLLRHEEATVFWLKSLTSKPTNPIIAKITDDTLLYWQETMSYIEDVLAERNIKSRS